METENLDIATKAFEKEVDIIIPKSAVVHPKVLEKFKNSLMNGAKHMVRSYSLDLSNQLANMDL